MALMIYLLTMAPRLTWATNLARAHIGRDGGDLVSAAWVMGVPHPTGYPTYTLLAWLFTRLPFGGIAWRVHLLSGFAGAGTVALVYAIGRRWARSREWMTGATAWGAAIGALLLGFAPLFWGHAIIAEVHTLHLFFIALVLWLMSRWHDAESPLPLAALAFGLGMGNHVTLAFLAPFILMLLWSGRERLSWRGVLASALALAAGLMVYAYLPWRAATDPVINWGAADTREGFWWMVSGRGYRRFFFALPRNELAPRLGQWWDLSLDQFLLPVWTLAFLGLWDLRHNRWLALGSLVHAAISLVYALGYNVSDAFVYLLPAYFYVALWIGRGAAFVLATTRRLYESDRDQEKVVSLVAAGLMLAPLVSLASEWQGMDLTHDWEVEIYAQEALEVVEPGSLILVAGDRNTFALWYYRYAEEWRPDVMVVNYVMLNFDWYRRVVTTHHPEMILPELAQTNKLNAVLLNLDQRAVYIAEDEDELPDMQLTPAGPLWQVTKP
jgi:4-amino-4-deoxy-L-arabinose transferase-like glycosyltransferase